MGAVSDPDHAGQPAAHPLPATLQSATTLTGCITEHAFLFAYGPGGNGKGVLFSIIQAVLGDYATTAMHDVFMVARNDQHPTNPRSSPWRTHGGRHRDRGRPAMGRGPA